MNWGVLIDPAPARVFLNILWRAHEGLLGWVATKGIAQDLGVNRSSVTRAVDALIEIGILEKRRRSDRYYSYRFLVYDDMMARVRDWAAASGRTQYPEVKYQDLGDDDDDGESSQAEA